MNKLNMYSQCLKAEIPISEEIEECLINLPSNIRGTYEKDKSIPKSI